MKRNTPICNSNPLIAATAIEIDICGMKPNVQAVWEYFEGAAFLYWADNKFICTDEACDFDNPRWVGESLGDFLHWLESLHDEIYDEVKYAENNF